MNHREHFNIVQLNQHDNITPVLYSKLALQPASITSKL